MRGRRGRLLCSFHRCVQGLPEVAGPENAWNSSRFGRSAAVDRPFDLGQTGAQKSVASRASGRALLCWPVSDHEDLSNISSAIVRAHKQAFGKGPESVKATFLDDMLIVVSKGGITATERTMLDHGHDESVREIRRVMEIEMVEPLSAMVSEITGREVINYQSQIMFAPDRVVAVYVFSDTLAPPRVAEVDGGS